MELEQKFDRKNNVNAIALLSVALVCLCLYAPFRWRYDPG